MSDRGRFPEEGVKVEIGLGGFGDMFRGLGGLVDLASRMAEEGKEQVTSSGEREVFGGKGKAVYGFSVRLGLGGKPLIESFGNVRSTASGPVVAEVREPLVDVFDEGEQVRVVVEIPGVDEQKIQVRVTDDILNLTAEGRDRKYQKEVLLPAAVTSTFERSYRNGVLELRLNKAQKPTA